MKNKMRLCVDTCVFGGYFDKEFSTESVRFIHALHKGKAAVLLSETLLQEIRRARQEINDLIDNLPVDKTEFLQLDEEVETLRDHYLKQKVVSKKQS